MTGLVVSDEGKAMNTRGFNYLVFRYLVIGLIALSVVLASGCASVTSHVSPEAKIGEYKNFYIVPSIDDTRGVGQAIHFEMQSRGFNVESGPVERVTDSSQVKVTYEAKWWWDITFYLLDLVIYFKDPSSDVLIASGQSHRPSLERKPVDEMVDEVLDKIYGIPPKKTE